MIEPEQSIAREDGQPSPAQDLTSEGRLAAQPRAEPFGDQPSPVRELTSEERLAAQPRAERGDDQAYQLERCFADWNSPRNLPGWVQPEHSAGHWLLECDAGQ